MREEAVLFGKSGSLVGVVTDPETSDDRGGRVAVLLLNSGFLHHVGPGAIYVKLARLMARLGFTSLRFDFSGIGDSGVRADSVPFERSAILEAQEAMDYLETTRGVRQFILMGICSGAAASFRIAYEDKRVVGAVLINPRGFGEKSGDAYRSSAQMRYYGRVGLSNSRSCPQRVGWIQKDASNGPSSAAGSCAPEGPDFPGRRGHRRKAAGAQRSAEGDGRGLQRMGLEPGLPERRAG